MHSDQRERERQVWDSVTKDWLSLAVVLPRRASTNRKIVVPIAAGERQP